MISEVNGEQRNTMTNAEASLASAPPLGNSSRSIDGFFRPRTLSTQVLKTLPATDNKDVSHSRQAPSAPVLDIPKPHAARNVNHARAHQPQPAKERIVHVSQSQTPSQSLSVRRGPANHVHHHSAQHSNTLRRDAVPAPQLSTHNLLRPKNALQHETPSLVALKKSADSIDTDRLVRAQSAPKSPMVIRHAKETQPLLPTFAPLSVQSTPTPTNLPTPPGTGDVPAAPSPQLTNQPNDIFEHALANANHFVDIRPHKAQYQRHAKHHIASMLAGSLALIVIATFVAYQNNPGIQLKVASLKAGVSTTMPNFAAVGFSYDGVRAGDGKLMLGFKGHNATYQLTQSNTNLSDVDMIQSIGSTNASGSPTYAVLMAGSTVVYRFSNTNATWVSGGKWYTVNGTSALTNDQVKSLVQHV